ncbi:MAG: HD domain-containing protein [Phycisphaerales bacterium]|jgi:(p)ppGpp synthase/HD superfamily hydrolase|nr:HD domain-containing protein [Phycisphaerales bacterium]
MSKSLWQEAAAFASEAHKHQTRNDGRPYVSHCFRVAMTVRMVFGFDDPEVIAAALLHDTIEDCDVDYDDILELFGRTVADNVAVMTKDMRLEEEIREIAYDKQLAEGPWQGRLIKLADVYDNLTDILPEKRKKFMSKVERILLLTEHDEQLQDAREQLQTLLCELVPC